MRIEILIRKVREEKNISIRRLSAMTGMSQGHISRIENGETMPTVLSIERIAIALRVDSKELYKTIP